MVGAARTRPRYHAARSACRCPSRRPVRHPCQGQLVSHPLAAPVRARIRPARDPWVPHQLPYLMCDPLFFPLTPWRFFLHKRDVCNPTFILIETDSG